MKCIKPFIFGSILVFVSFSSNTWALWTGRVIVERVQTSNLAVFVRTDPPSEMINPDGCAKTSHYRLNPDVLLFENQVQVFLTALASGKPVTISLNGCNKDYPEVVGVAVMND